MMVIFDIDGVVRDVSNSYRRALADTVEQFTGGAYRPSLAEVDVLKSEGCWNNDWEASQELVLRYFEAQGLARPQVNLNYEEVVAFFQSRYRGKHWDGYIQDEPLLMSAAYLASLSQAGVAWGFFSGATRGSATFVLEGRLGLPAPALIAMEDAPGKPDPTGLLAMVTQLEQCRFNAELANDAAPADPAKSMVCYVGDTVADMQTVVRARALNAHVDWVGIGVIPPHVRESTSYSAQLQAAGASLVLAHVEQLTPGVIASLAA
jgi:HAD superfamily phosphatase